MTNYSTGVTTDTVFELYDTLDSINYCARAKIKKLELTECDLEVIEGDVIRANYAIPQSIPVKERWIQEWTNNSELLIVETNGCQYYVYGPTLPASSSVIKSRIDWYFSYLSHLTDLVRRCENRPPIVLKGKDIQLNGDHVKVPFQTAICWEMEKLNDFKRTFIYFKTDGTIQRFNNCDENFFTNLPYFRTRGRIQLGLVEYAPLPETVFIILTKNVYRKAGAKTTKKEIEVHYYKWTLN